MNGLIFFEDGTIVPFGQLASIQGIAKAAQRVIPELLQQEREQLLNTITKSELKQIAERLSTESQVNDNNSNV